MVFKNRLHRVKLERIYLRIKIEQNLFTVFECMKDYYIVYLQDVLRTALFYFVLISAEDTIKGNELKLQLEGI